MAKFEKLLGKTMKNKKHIHLKQRDLLHRTHDFNGCYVETFNNFPIKMYYGERQIFTIDGYDTYNGGGWVGVTSECWLKTPFGYDLAKALEWLHQSEDSIEDTLTLWTVL